MLIISGTLQIAPGRRDDFVAGSLAAAAAARNAPGCFAFVVAADPLEPDRVIVLERWATEDDLLAFRGSGPSDEQMADVAGGDVQRYEVTAVGAG